MLQVQSLYAIQGLRVAVIVVWFGLVDLDHAKLPLKWYSIALSSYQSA